MQARHLIALCPIRHQAISEAGMILKHEAAQFAIGAVPAVFTPSSIAQYFAFASSAQDFYPCRSVVGGEIDHESISNRFIVATHRT
jgi:hypothetical protein